MTKKLVNNFLPVIGLMSGTSMDGINATLVFTNGKELRRTKFSLISLYQKQTKNILNDFFIDIEKNILNKKKLVLLDNLIAKDHIKAIIKLIRLSNIKPQLIGFHGQTVYHNPKKKMSIQAGDSNLIANKLKINVVSNFRQNDINNGGQGAPIAPIYHKLIIKNMSTIEPSCLINIGGISNITFYDGVDLIGFDTGPGNCLMDFITQNDLNLEYDNNGEIASTGNANTNIVNAFLNDCYFNKSFPKSLDKLYFFKYLDILSVNENNVADKLATLIEFTVQSIAKGIKQFKSQPKKIVIVGGGAKNVYLLNRLKEELKCNLYTGKDLNFPGEMVEAELIAYLAVRSVNKLPITFPLTTGVNLPTTGGKLFIPSKQNLLS